MSYHDSGTELLNELAHEFVECLRRGDKPTVEQLATEHPELADEIRELFPTLQLIEGIDPTAPRSETCHQLSGDEFHYPWQLGEYRILRRNGRGGMGTVFEAVQESLDRHVAIKVLSPRDAQNATPNRDEMLLVDEQKWRTLRYSESPRCLNLFASNRGGLTSQILS